MKPYGQIALTFTLSVAEWSILKTYCFACTLDKLQSLGMIKFTVPPMTNAAP